MTDTQLRFLRAIAERLPIDRVAELYMFPPMRQGTMETGIAVVAAVREVAPDLAAVLAAAPDVSPEATPGEANDASAAAIGDAVIGDAGIGGARDDGVSREPATGASAGEACDPTEDASRDAGDTVGEGGDAGREADVAAAADAVASVAANVAGVVETSAAASAGPVAVVTPAATSAPRERHAVYTARYRLALKGPERGRWEFNLVDEADAPLLTVEMVVRGVQQRSGEGADPERLETPALRELLGVAAA